MGTLVVYSDAADDGLTSSSAVAATAQDGGGTFLSNTATQYTVGQEYYSGTYYAYESFVAFDTSTLGSATVGSASLDLTTSLASVSTAFNVEARAKSWLPTVTSADWMNRSALGAATLYGSIAAGSTLPTMTIATSAINTSGMTEMALASSRHRLGSVPTGRETVSIRSSETTGTTSDPRLTIGYPTPSAGTPFTAGAVVYPAKTTTISRLTVLATPDTVSDSFTAAITSPKQVSIARVDIIDPATTAVIATITDDVDDGSVTVDVSRGNRRTFQLRLLNKDGKYTPTDAVTYFAFNSMVRIYRGFRYIDSRGGETDEYCLLGTFLIDRPEVFVERNMSVITIDGSDRWKVIASGGFSSNKTYSAGTYVNQIIYEAVRECGIEQYLMNLDPLSDRDVALTKIGTKLQWEIGDSRADFLKSLCDQFGLEIFFDVAGLLTTRPVVDPTTVSPKWTFAPAEDGVMLGVTKIQSDLNLFNDIIVSGETSQGVFTGARAEKADTADALVSATSIYGTMGRRVFHYKAPLVYSTDQALIVATKLYYEKCLVDEEIKLPTICLPHLDGNDVIEITESTWSKVDDRYLAQRFDIPLREARQVIETKKGRAIS